MALLVAKLEQEWSTRAQALGNPAKAGNHRGRGPKEGSWPRFFFAMKVIDMTSERINKQDCYWWRWWRFKQRESVSP